MLEQYKCILFHRYAKKNQFANTRNTIRELELDISENTAKKYGDVWMMQGCIVSVQQKKHSYRQRTEKHVWSSPRLTEIER